MTKSFWQHLLASAALLAISVSLFRPSRSLHEELSAATTAALYPPDGNPSIAGFLVFLFILVAVACLSIRVNGSDRTAAFLPLYAISFLPPLGAAIAGRFEDALVVLGGILAMREIIDITHRPSRAFLAALYLGIASALSSAALLIFLLLLPIVLLTLRTTRRWLLFLVGFAIPFGVSLIAGGESTSWVFAVTEKWVSPEHFFACAKIRVGVIRETANVAFLALYAPFVLAAAVGSFIEWSGMERNTGRILLYVLLGLTCVYCVLPMPDADAKILMAMMMAVLLLVANLGRKILRFPAPDEGAMIWGRALETLFLIPPAIVLLRLLL